MRYALEGELRFVRDGDSSPLPGHYEATFRTDEGAAVDRYVTDKGRAALLRMFDEGRRVLDEQEFNEFTIEPTLEHLLSVTEAEGGEGG